MVPAWEVEVEKAAKAAAAAGKSPVDVGSAAAGAATAEGVSPYDIVQAAGKATIDAAKAESRPLSEAIKLGVEAVVTEGLKVSPSLNTPDMMKISVVNTKAAGGGSAAQDRARQMADEMSARKAEATEDIPTLKVPEPMSPVDAAEDARMSSQAVRDDEDRVIKKTTHAARNAARHIANKQKDVADASTAAAFSVTKKLKEPPARVAQKAGEADKEAGGNIESVAKAIGTAAVKDARLEGMSNADAVKAATEGATRLALESHDSVEDAAILGKVAAFAAGADPKEAAASAGYAAKIAAKRGNMAPGEVAATVAKEMEKADACTKDISEAAGKAAKETAKMKKMDTQGVAKVTGKATLKHGGNSITAKTAAAAAAHESATENGAEDGADEEAATAERVAEAYTDEDYPSHETHGLHETGEKSSTTEAPETTEAETTEAPETTEAAETTAAEKAAGATTAATAAASAKQKPALISATDLSQAGEDADALASAGEDADDVQDEVDANQGDSDFSEAEVEGGEVADY